MEYRKPIVIDLDSSPRADGAASPLCYPGSGAGEIGEACVGGGAPGYTVCTGGTGADNTIDCASGTADAGNCLYGTSASDMSCMGGSGGFPDSSDVCRVGPMPAL